MHVIVRRLLRSMESPSPREQQFNSPSSSFTTTQNSGQNQRNLTRKGTVLSPSFSPILHPSVLLFPRFTPEEKAKRPALCHIPFGWGPRNCIGMRFALMEAKMALIEILKKYTFVQAPEMEVSFLNSSFLLDMWQFHVEVKGYFITYFDHVAMFEVLYRWTSIKARTQTRFIDAWISNKSMHEAHISLTLNGSSAMQCFKHGK